MPNNTRTQIDAVWVDGYVPPKTDWEDLERKVFGSWNGVTGGVYNAPAGGAGGDYTFTGAGLQVTGPLRLTRGAAVRGPASAFVIRAGEWPQLGSTHIARARNIVQPISRYSTKYPHLWTRNHDFGGVGSVALACRLTYSRVVETSPLYIPLRVVDGSTLTSCTIRFRVATRRVFAPIEMPKMRILRIPLNSGATGGTVLPEPLKTTSDGLGFDFTPLVTSATTWYNDGLPQSFTYVCDKNHVIDTSLYSYVVHLIEERGTTSPDDDFDGIRFTERKADVNYVQVNSTQDLTGLESSQNATEGDAAFSGIRMLLVDSDARLVAGTQDPSYAYANGIWLQNTGTWPRAEDCDTSDDFSPFWIVNVNGGYKNKGGTWQCQYPSKSQRINFTSTSVDTLTKILMDRAKPRGNIYHSLVPTFDVPDLRFQ